jgi:hypothetical protein
MKKMDATKPTDVDLISTHAEYIREVRAAVNALSVGSGVGVNSLAIAAGTTSLTVGTDLGLYGFEVVIVTAAAAVNISKILGGIQGQVKRFVFDDNNITLVDGVAASGNLYLNRLPALTSWIAQANDSIDLVNIGGDGGVTTHGYWQEVSRQIAVK